LLLASSPRLRGCAAARLPKSRPEFWGPKLAGNVERDKRNRATLEAANWRVMVIWECETRDCAALARLANVIKAAPKLR
jgi:DNA mismatch endonuclease (patch repair protein)